MTIINKKIGIFGLGKTGISVFDFTKSNAKEIICWDDSDKNCNNFSKYAGSKYLSSLSNTKWQNLDTIIISPGIPRSHEIYSLAIKYKILISSDIQLFYEANLNSKFIAITGTNGKSTTTALIGHILRKNRLDYHVGGNIGLPVLSLPQNALGYVLELSSFQIDLLNNFTPDISVLLNITPDHIDRHGSFEEYCKAKAKILNSEGLKIIGTNTSESKKIFTTLLNSGEKKLIPIGSGIKEFNINCTDRIIIDNFYNKETYTLSSLSNLVGKHNYENIAAAFAVCRALGLNSKDIIQHIHTFKCLDHRMQLIGTIGHISFYNDSKATNVASAKNALESLNNIYWLAGGIFKEDNMSLLEKSVKNIKKAYLFGKSKLLIANQLKDKVDYKICKTMEEAFNCAVNDANVKNNKANILLAPACASFDQFKNFEDRGNKFIQLYNARSE